MMSLTKKVDEWRLEPMLTLTHGCIEKYPNAKAVIKENSEP